MIAHSYLKCCALSLAPATACAHFELVLQRDLGDPYEPKPQTQPHRRGSDSQASSQPHESSAQRQHSAGRRNEPVRDPLLVAREAAERARREQALQSYNAAQGTQSDDVSSAEKAAPYGSSGAGSEAERPALPATRSMQRQTSDAQRGGWPKPGETMNTASFRSLSGRGARSGDDGAESAPYAPPHRRPAYSADQDSGVADSARRTSDGVPQRHSASGDTSTPPPLVSSGRGFGSAATSATDYTARTPSGVSTEGSVPMPTWLQSGSVDANAAPAGSTQRPASAEGEHSAAAPAHDAGYAPEQPSLRARAGGDAGWSAKGGTGSFGDGPGGDQYPSAPFRTRGLTGSVGGRSVPSDRALHPMDSMLAGGLTSNWSLSRVPEVPEADGETHTPQSTPSGVQTAPTSNEPIRRHAQPGSAGEQTQGTYVAPGTMQHDTPVERGGAERAGTSAASAQDDADQQTGSSDTMEVQPGQTPRHFGDTTPSIFQSPGPTPSQTPPRSATPVATSAEYRPQGGTQQRSYVPGTEAASPQAPPTDVPRSAGVKAGTAIAPQLSNDKHRTHSGVPASNASGEGSLFESQRQPVHATAFYPYDSADLSSTTLTSAAPTQQHLAYGSTRSVPSNTSVAPQAAMAQAYARAASEHDPPDAVVHVRTAPPPHDKAPSLADQSSELSLAQAYAQAMPYNGSGVPHSQSGHATRSVLSTERTASRDGTVDATVGSQQATQGWQTSSVEPPEHSRVVTGLQEAAAERAQPVVFMQRTSSAPVDPIGNERAAEVVAYRMAQQQLGQRLSDARYISQNVRNALRPLGR